VAGSKISSIGSRCINHIDELTIAVVVFRRNTKDLDTVVFEILNVVLTKPMPMKLQVRIYEKSR